MILNEEQTMLRETVAQFFAAQAPVEKLRELREASTSVAYDQTLWSEMVALGLTGITVPEEFEGLNFGWMAVGAIAQEAGRRLVASPFLSSVVFAQNLLLNCGSRVQIEAHLPSLLSGEGTASVALNEGRFFSPQMITVGESDMGLNGVKTRVLNGQMSDQLLVITKRASGDMGVAVMSAQQANVAVEAKRSMDLHGHASITLNRLTDGDIEWLEGDAVEAGVVKTIDQATIVLAAEMMGSAREVLERTVDYLGEREQFDVKLGTFQALQHRCAQMYCELELAESAVSAALMALDDNAPNISLLSSSAKALANDCFTLISTEAVQLHGGMGVTEEMDIGLFLKRSRVCNQLLGSSSYHRDRFATLSGF
jgi:alkylation response protein AidB-like acyl-CoA dehydrogenase